MIMRFTLLAFSYPVFVIILRDASADVQNLAFKTTKKPIPFGVRRVDQRHVVSRLKCITECSKHAVCVAFKYKRETSSCTIFRQVPGSGSKTLQPDSDTTYGILNVVHRYIGCYRDLSPNLLPWGFIIDREGMTTLTCKLHCYGLSYTYFGTKIVDECSCGDVIKEGYHEVSGTKCKTPCAGDKSEMCGGFDLISIYKIE